MSLSSHIQWSQQGVFVNFLVFPHRPQRGLDTVLFVVFAIANILHCLACGSPALFHRVARRLSPYGESFTSGVSHVSFIFDEQINRKRGFLIPSILPHSLLPFVRLQYEQVNGSPQSFQGTTKAGQSHTAQGKASRLLAGLLVWAWARSPYTPCWSRRIVAQYLCGHRA